MNADDISRLLDQLGQKLSPSAEKAFALAVRYQITASLIPIVVSLILLVFCGAGYLAILRWVRAHPHADEFEPLMASGSLTLGTVVLVVEIVCCSINLLNPEYAALRDILSALGGAK